MSGNGVLSNYAREIEIHWKQKESQRKVFLCNSPQLNLRRHIIEWIKSVSEKLKVSYRTVHLAVYILDVFMDNHSIIRERLGFVSLVCLMLAAKFEELDSKIPNITELNKFDGFRYSNKDFITLEVMILKFLDFGLTQPTVAHFAEYYAIGSVIPHDLKSSRISFRCLQEVVYNIVGEFLEISLQEVKFLQHPPSKVASACILAARRRVNLSPAWTSALEEMTGYKEESLIYCLALLMRNLHQENVQRRRYVESPDQGYISESP